MNSRENKLAAAFLTRPCVFSSACYMTEGSVPTFVKRRSTTKRRRRSILPQATATSEGDANSGTNQDVNSIRPNVNIQSIAAAHVRPGRRVMRAQLDVQGYEAKLPTNEDRDTQADYSTAGLRRLREAHDAPQPETKVGNEPPISRLEEPKIEPKPVEKPRTTSRLTQERKKGNSRIPLDPFSDAWRGTIEDDEIQILPAPEMDENATQGPEDEEWISAQLRRGGMEKVGRQLNDAQVKLVMEDEEGSSRDVRGLANALKRVDEALSEALERVKWSDMKESEMEVAEKEARERIDSLEKDRQKWDSKAIFYESMGRYLGKVWEFLGDSEEELTRYATYCCDCWEEEARLVHVSLNGGEDEFGRVRPGRLEIDVDENLEETSPLTDAGIEMLDIAGRLEEWKQLDQEAYNECRKEISALLDRLAEGGGDLDWVLDMDTGLFETEMTRLKRLGEKWIAAKIRVRDEASRERVGSIGRLLNLGDVLSEKVTMELKACVRLQGDIAKCIDGGLNLCQIVGRDLGIVKWLNITNSAVQKLTGSGMSWAFEEGREIFSDEAIQQLEKFR